VIAAVNPIQRPRSARLLVLDARGRVFERPRGNWIDLVGRGDLLIANDAATLPASLAGRHARTGKPLEVRLAGRSSLAPGDVLQFTAVVFGEGDFHLRTEDRPAPPHLVAGDELIFGADSEPPVLLARVDALLDHPRLIRLTFIASAPRVWAALSRVGRPIQYAHIQTPLRLWDVWTPIAGVPVAFEPPSAGFALDWQTLRRAPDLGIGFATITLAAGISSTGDPEFDRRFPLDEPYRVPAATAAAIQRTREAGGRIIAVGTTVVRALEHAVLSDIVVRSGEGVATDRIGPSTKLRIVDALLSGTHEPGSSHYELLRAFAGDRTLARASDRLDRGGYLTHEFGDSMYVERSVNRLNISPDPEACAKQQCLASAVP
jgi:S-adenosylmethionine:tRNA ribosyltransferase-isomerase